MLTSWLLLIKWKVFYLIYLEAEPWKDKPHEDDDDHFKYLKFPRDDLKFKRYDKEDREPAKFIDKKWNFEFNKIKIIILLLWKNSQKFKIFLYIK